MDDDIDSIIDMLNDNQPPANSNKYGSVANGGLMLERPG